MHARENEPSAPATGRKPLHQIWLNWNKPACCSFGLGFSHLNVPARKIYIFPFQPNELSRSQPGESAEREIKPRLFVSAPNQIRQLFRGQDSDLSPSISCFGNFFRFSCLPLGQIPPRPRKVKERNNRHPHIIARTGADFLCD